ncbi:MAG TPA: lipase maturation factor family protein [Hyphomicrobium sp.]|nr:lipase maturation factor family protein [Hyphomicrobium sp.]
MIAPVEATFVFDGACGICRTWVEYWRRLTGDRVVYRPYQEAAADFPAIPREAFERATHLIFPDGTALSGAAATYKLLSLVPGHGAWWWLYRHVPGAAALSEGAYGFLSTHRGLLAGITHALWGRTLEPPRYALVSWLFLHGLGLIYLAAFVSLALQVRGLVGEAGILPAGEYLTAAHQGWGASAYWRMPTLFWLDSSDATLKAGAWAGIALAVLLAIGIAQRLALLGLFVLYLSFIYAGQIFLNYQWDMLLVETGFLAIFLTGGSHLIVWLFRLLLFRFLFLAGVAKIISGDRTWRDLTALDYHLFTQPLPSPLAYYAAQLPHWLLAFATAATLVIELFAVAMIFMPRRPRMVAAALVVILQAAIMLTGSYNWFNLLTVLLCLFLVDDQALRYVSPRPLVSRVTNRAPRPGRVARIASAAIALILVPVGLNQIYAPLSGRNIPFAGALSDAVAPFLIANPYGLFATVTTTRPALTILGSNDGQKWRPYVLPFLPGPPERAPTWNIPYQPRLDWQLWFAAYGNAGEQRWTERLLQRILEGSPHVLDLFAVNPFPDKPPRRVRIDLSTQRFSDATTSQHTWWDEHPEGIYFPSVSLGDLQRAADAQNAMQNESHQH